MAHFKNSHCRVQSRVWLDFNVELVKNKRDTQLRLDTMMRPNCSLKSVSCAILALLAITLSSACTDTSGPSKEIIEYARSATPDNPETAEIYLRSCMACHGKGTSDAPLTGDPTAWQPRMDKGMDTLLNNVVSGMGGMPPYGLCMDCNAADFQALITFMATPAQN